jgi:hypothetical protein
MSIAQDKDTVISEEELLTSVIPQDHAYRKLNRLINFDEIAASFGTKQKNKLSKTL